MPEDQDLRLNDADVVRIAARSGSGLDELVRRIAKAVGLGQKTEDVGLATCAISSARSNGLFAATGGRRIQRY